MYFYTHMSQVIEVQLSHYLVLLSPIGAVVSNYIHVKQWDVINLPCPIFNIWS